MPKSLDHPVALLLLLALALPTTVLAQAPGTASLFGVVFDTAGQPAAGYPCSLKIPDGTRVILGPTEADGICGTSGLPPGKYELLVFAPGGRETLLFSKQVTLAAGQEERLEVRLTSDKPVVAGTSKPAEGSTATGTAGFNWETLTIAALVLGGALAILILLAMRSRNRPS